MQPSETHDACRDAGRLLQWGLRPQERPAHQPEYRKLVDRYLDEPAFRDLARAVAAGLGLAIADAGDHGLVLAPEPGSAFELSGAEARSPSTYADDRLLDGLVQVAIASVVFPRPRDLEEDPDLARPPVSLEEIQAHLDTLCKALEESARGRPDPEAGDEARGLYEAWRVYQQRREHTGRSRSTRRVIEHGLEQLRAHGCFTADGAGRRRRWRPTRRYQVLVQDLASTAIYREVQAALAPEENR